MRDKYPNKKMSEIYGAEHLLRLFVRLPYLLAQTTLDESEMTHIQAKLGEFLKYVAYHLFVCPHVLLTRYPRICWRCRFLQKHHSQFFMSEYVPMSEEYHKQIEAPGAVAAGDLLPLKT
jgi:hypothetical protein